MVSKLNSAPRNSTPSSRLDDDELDEREFEWLLCLSSAFQTSRRFLFESGRPPMRVAGDQGVVPAQRLHGRVWRSIAGWAIRKTR